MPFRLGTRGSPLALVQAEAVRAALLAAQPEAQVEITIIRTEGDRVTDRALAEIGGKGLFTEAIEQGLLNGSIDIAVHSMKDVPTTLPGGLTIGAYLEREDPRDVLIGATCIEALPAGAGVGTASMRRRAQLLAKRPDLRVELLRGNVQTRLRKLEEGLVDATLLAFAGLRRLGLGHVGTPLSIEAMLPAVSQGAIGVECRADDSIIHKLLTHVDHAPTRLCVEVERAMLLALDGSCRTPIAGLAELHGDEVRLAGLVASPDGSHLVTERATARIADARRMGFELGTTLRLQADPSWFEP
ncbi:hydroxymethylbilane synthase [Arboricoccus pini]|uniref:Porphobilinogen deaminase n=2 Tax=Arboricoccus pini TaxID=1963835 RepID=A0A212Q198_9PROT|nr:hydroxymethylbilane synthase [Arboricoccus pini]